VIKWITISEIRIIVRANLRGSVDCSDPSDRPSATFVVEDIPATSTLIYVAPRSASARYPTSGSSAPCLRACTVVFNVGALKVF
jgi:hypothetical protein